MTQVLSVVVAPKRRESFDSISAIYLPLWTFYPDGVFSTHWHFTYSFVNPSRIREFLHTKTIVQWRNVLPRCWKILSPMLVACMPYRRTNNSLQGSQCHQSPNGWLGASINMYFNFDFRGVLNQAIKMPYLNTVVSVCTLGVVPETFMGVSNNLKAFAVAGRIKGKAVWTSSVLTEPRDLRSSFTAGEFVLLTGYISTKTSDK